MKLKHLAILSAINSVSTTVMIPMASQANEALDVSLEKKANIPSYFANQKLGKGKLLSWDRDNYLKAKDEGGTSTKPERNLGPSNYNSSAN